MRLRWSSLQAAGGIMGERWARRPWAPQGAEMGGASLQRARGCSFFAPWVDTRHPGPPILLSMCQTAHLPIACQLPVDCNPRQVAEMHASYPRASICVRVPNCPIACQLSVHCSPGQTAQLHASGPRISARSCLCIAVCARVSNCMPAVRAPNLGHAPVCPAVQMHVNCPRMAIRATLS